MSVLRVFSGLVLVASMFSGCAVWASSNYTNGAITFIAGAALAGLLHNAGSKKGE